MLPPSRRAVPRHARVVGNFAGRRRNRAPARDDHLRIRERAQPGSGIVVARLSCMRHAAVLLIVGTLAGTPVADLLCVSRCDQTTAAQPLGCHHDVTASASTVIRDGDDSCARLFVSIAFLREEAQRPPAVMPASASPAMSFGPGEALLAPTHRPDGGTPAFASMLVLRL